MKLNKIIKEESTEEISDSLDLYKGLFYGFTISGLLYIFHKIYSIKELIQLKSIKKKIERNGIKIAKLNFQEEIINLNTQIQLSEFRCSKNLKEIKGLHDQYFQTNKCILDIFENYLLGFLDIYFTLLSEQRTQLQNYKHLIYYTDFANIKELENKTFSDTLTDSYHLYLDAVKILFKSEAKKYIDSKNYIQIIENFNKRAVELYQKRINNTTQQHSIKKPEQQPKTDSRLIKTLNTGNNKPYMSPKPNIQPGTVTSKYQKHSVINKTDIKRSNNANARAGMGNTIYK